MKEIIIVIICIILGILFHFYPKIDLDISAYFYDAATQSFPYREAIFAKAVYWAVRFVCVSVILWLGYIIAIYFVRKKENFINHKIAIYLLIAMLFGPGIIVHNIVKPLYERPRPVETTIFGGEKQFFPAFHINVNEDMGGASFVSGHASVGFFFMALAFVYQDRKKFWLAFGISLGTLFGIVRVMQGGAFRK